MKTSHRLALAAAFLIPTGQILNAGEWWIPYSPPCTERENVFAFTEKPTVKLVAKDRYEIAFAVKGNCDVTVAIVDTAGDPSGLGRGTVVRHLASGVLGPNAPEPFWKNSLSQKVYWNGKNDLGVYVREPGKLKVRVMLGLKPVFDYRLGGRSPHNIPGYVCGIAVGPRGAVVLSKRWRMHARRFDLDGEYVMSILPPPAGTPEEKMAGMGYVEYEPGKKAVQGPNAYLTVADRGWMFWGVDWGGLGDVQPVLCDDSVYFVGFNGREGENPPAPLYYLNFDGTTDFNGVRGVPFSYSEQRFPRLAASPDGKWLYMTGAGSGQFGGEHHTPVVLRRARTGADVAEPFLGKAGPSKKGMISGIPGSDNESLNGPAGIDVDAKGRIYVCDHANNRIQIFSPEGKYLKTVPVDRPMLIRVHRKTNAMYVLHAARVEGSSINRLTKYASFENPREAFHQDGLFAAVFALDSWSAAPRLWMAGGETIMNKVEGFAGGAQPVVIYEDTGKGLKKLIDFDERAKRDDGPRYYGRWRNEKGGSGGSVKIDCDPTRERVHYHSHLMFDLPSGRFLGQWGAASHRALIDDIAFDKRGYLHVHFNPSFYFQGVGRVDTSRPQKYAMSDYDGHAEYYPEVPYDYGISGEGKGGRGAYWKGVLPVKDQGGAHAFQFGVGVNMRGDVAVASQIYYVPKMEDSVESVLIQGNLDRKKLFGKGDTGDFRFSTYIRELKEKEKRGEEVYFMKRRPGIPLSGTTIWTYDKTGELRQECAAVIGGIVNGIEIDEDGELYFTCTKMRVTGDKPEPFLHGRGGTFGGPPHKGNRNPMTGTLMKAAGKDVRMLKGNAMVPMTPPPDRLPDLIDSGYDKDEYIKGTWAWAEGVRWMYAGASPIRFRGCHCPTMRFCTDWFKRSFTPEGYRHSIGVVDTNGNLVMHLGRYGNFDSGDGPKSKVPVGGDGIGVFHPRAVSTTDNYIVFSSWGERVSVLRIEYHVEETVSIDL